MVGKVIAGSSGHHNRQSSAECSTDRDQTVAILEQGGADLCAGESSNIIKV